MSGCGSMDSAGDSISIGMIGLSTMESIPVYHYHPGGSALRVRLASYTDFFKCGDEAEICLFSRRGSMEPVNVPAPVIRELAREWRVDAVIFEGFMADSYIDQRILGELESIGVTAAFRTFAVSISNVLQSAPLIVVDYPLDYLVDYGLSVTILENIARLLDGAGWVEVNVYIERPLIQKLTPLAEVLEGRDTALHVHVLEHEGGMPITKLYERLKRRVKHVYVHNYLYPHRDTFCPACGATVATRTEDRLTSLEAPEGKCWRCGSPIPFHGRIRKKTPDNLYIVTGGVRWVHPLRVERIRSYLGRM